MNQAYQWLLAHPVIMSSLALACYHAASAFVDSLEMPDATSSKFYRFMFKFTNRFAASYGRAKASDGPAGNKQPTQG